MTSTPITSHQSPSVVFTTVAPTLYVAEPVDELTQKIRDEIAASNNEFTKWAAGAAGPSATFIGERRPPIPAPLKDVDRLDEHGKPTPFWPVFLDQDGTPVPAWTVLELVRSGEARIVDEELDESVKIINWLRPAVRGSFLEAADAIAAVGEEARQRMREMKVLFDQAGITVFWEQDEPNGARKPKMRPVMLTVDEVAKLFRVSATTVRRWEGKQLPRAVRVGHSMLWRAKDIHTMLGRVG